MNCRKNGFLDKKSALTAADPTTAGAVQARFDGVEFADIPSAPTEIMWMPGGVHTITASQNGKPKKVRVTVDSGTAAVLQQALGIHLAASQQRPYFDFDHENGPASGWPVSFEWREMPQPGVYARIEWSGSGRDAVTGRSYRAFSPTFFTDDGNPARVTGAPLNMGGLVNNPAFKAIRPIWSKDRTSDSSMKATAKLLAAIAALTALRNGRAPILAKANDDAGKQALSAHDQQIEAKLAEIETLRAAVEAQSASESDEGERAKAQLAAKDAEIALIQAKNERLERDRLSRIEADADAAIRVAVERGAIAAQDTTTQAHWKRLLVADPSNAVLLANQPGNPAIGGAVVARNAGSGSRIEVGQADSRKVLEAFGQELDPKKRGAIWAKDLRKRVEEGADFVNEVTAITNDLQAGTPHLQPWRWHGVREQPGLDPFHGQPGHPDRVRPTGTWGGPTRQRNDGDGPFGRADPDLIPPDLGTIQGHHQQPMDLCRVLQAGRRRRGTAAAVAQPGHCSSQAGLLPPIGRVSRKDPFQAFSRPFSFISRGYGGVTCPQRGR